MINFVSSASSSNLSTRVLVVQSDRFLEILVMRLAHGLLLAELFWLHFTGSALALPENFARQACESIVCVPSVDWGAIGGWVNELIKIVPLGIQTLPKPDFQSIPKEDSPVQTSSPSPSPDVQLFIENSPQGSEVCTEAPPLDNLEEEYDPVQRNEGPCNGAIAQLIWPVDCQDMGRNVEVGNVLFQMDPSYLTSYDPLCPTRDGVAFWQAQLTPTQIEQLREHIDVGVRAVSRNSPYKFGKLTEVHPSPVKSRDVPSSPGTREDLEPRQLSLFTERRRPFDESLEYLSTPTRHNRGLQYVYFKTSDPKVPVYVMDTGLTPKYNSLDNVEIKWIYGLGAQEQAGDSSSTRHGTCIASKIGGQIVGVNSNVRLTIVKLISELGSFLDALAKVVASIQDELALNPMERCVVHISGGYLSSEGDPDMQRLQDLIQHLISLQAVVVTSAGYTTTGSKSTIIDHWPAALAGTMDIIAVGAVQIGLTDHSNNKLFGFFQPGSKGGPALTVRAPAEGWCSTGISTTKWIYRESWTVTGSDFPTAIVSGLVAYFLSIPPLREKLLAHPSLLPRAMKIYLKFMSRARDIDQLVMSVWNGLDGRGWKKGQEYTEWVGLDF